MKNILLLLLLITGFSSCKKWLDVKPKTQVESDVNFQDEQGYKDALTGVYLGMVSQNLYGKELTFGFVEVLAKNYTQFTTLNNYLEDSKYNYAFAATKTRIDNIWNGNYNQIANINNLIANINKADKSMFADSNYNVIKGEAYALRAFHHFDLLRLYAPSPASGGMNTPAIPYRENFVSENVKQSTVKEVIEKVIADLQVASALLKTSDPIVPGSKVPSTTTGFLRDRTYKLNYFAVRGLMARVYLYSNDSINALACAKEVINSNVFPATPVSQIIAGNKTMSTEVLFNLYINSLQTLYDASYSPTLPQGMLLSSTEWATVYETNSGGSADYRYLYTTEINGLSRYTVKFRPTTATSAPAASQNRLPLLRVSEMYYIAAECLATTDPVTAIGYLNTVRKNRNLVNLVTTLSTADIQSEIFKEYRKEFITEGQLFFYYKRLNLAKIEFTQTVGNNSVYVLPKPDNEIEYGSIK